MFTPSEVISEPKSEKSDTRPLNLIESDHDQIKENLKLVQRKENLNLIPRKISRKNIVENEEETVLLNTLSKILRDKDVPGLEFRNDAYWIRLPKKQSKNIFDYSLNTNESISENLARVHKEMTENVKGSKLPSKIIIPEIFSSKRRKKKLNSNSFIELLPKLQKKFLLKTENLLSKEQMWYFKKNNYIHLSKKLQNVVNGSKQDDTSSTFNRQKLVTFKNDQRCEIQTEKKSIISEYEKKILKLPF